MNEGVALLASVFVLAVTLMQLSGTTALVSANTVFVRQLRALLFRLCHPHALFAGFVSVTTLYSSIQILYNVAIVAIVVQTDTGVRRLCPLIFPFYHISVYMR